MINLVFAPRCLSTCHISWVVSCQVGLSAMVSALGSLKAPWVQTSSGMESQSFMFGKIVYICIYIYLYVYCLFHRKGLQKWPSSRKIPGNCFLNEVFFFCFCFDVLCQTSNFSIQEVSATQKFTPRQSHPPEPQRTVSRCLLRDLRCLKVMTWLPGRSLLGARAHKTCWTWL